MDPVIVDAYEGDGSPDWTKLVAAGLPWAGAFVKCTEGTHYAPSWFGEQWRKLKEAAGARLGVTFFRGCYHYLRVDQNAITQAALFCDQSDAAGGWEPGDLYPVVDVERANNGKPTTQAVVWAVTDFVREVKRRTGRAVMLYGGELLYSLGITDHMGCSKLWIARYTDSLPVRVYQRIGWRLEDVWGWQYTDGHADGYGLAGYPTTTPIGPLDTTAVIVAGGSDNAIVWMRGA